MQQVAERLGVHPDTVRDWTKKKALTYLRTPGGQRRFRVEDVDAFIAAITKAAKAAEGEEVA